MGDVSFLSCEVSASLCVYRAAGFVVSPRIAIEEVRLVSSGSIEGMASVHCTSPMILGAVVLNQSVIFNEQSRSKPRGRVNLNVSEAAGLLAIEGLGSVTSRRNG